jgi:antitoxin VapB
MSLNIKNDETHELVRELANLTGETMTQAVATSVRERLVRVRHQAVDPRQRADALLALGRDVAERLTEPYRSADHGELLYDDQGLPR